MPQKPNIIGKEDERKKVIEFFKRQLRLSGMSEDFIAECSNFRIENGKALMEIPRSRTNF